ncbi:MAG: AsmA-like C-terminal domain-containing protein [Proteobacteria bacterium]|nr:AsmA-like C-terminal domain-containing protein [Pseudomonadota bacterium]
MGKKTNIIRRVIQVLIALTTCIAILAITSVPLPFLPSYLSSRATGAMPELKVDIAKVSLKFGTTGIIMLQLEDIHTSYAQEHNAYIDRILIKPVWINMLRPGKVHSLVIEASLPNLSQELNLIKTAKNTQNTQALPNYKELHEIITKMYAQNYDAMRRLVFKIPVVSLQLPGETGHSQVIELRGITARLGKSKQQLEVIVGGKVRFHNRDSRLKASIKDEDGGFIVDAKMHNIPLQWLNTWITDLDTNLQIQLNAVSKVSDLNTWPDVQFILHTGSGSIGSNQALYERIDVTSIYAQGIVSRGLSQIQVPHINARIHGLSFAGNLEFNQDKVVFNTTSNEPFAALSALHIWPHNLAIHVRQWVQHNVLAGIIEQAEMRLQIPLIQYQPQFAKMTDKDISASFSVRDGVVQYIDHMPPINGANAVVKLDANNAKVSAIHGKVLDASLQGECSISDFSAPKTILKFTGVLDGAAQDSINLALTHFYTQHDISAKTIEVLQPLRRAQGTAQSNIDVSLDLGEPDESLEIKVKSKLNNIIVRDVLGKFNVSAAQLMATFANNKLKVTGLASTESGISGNLEYNGDFKDNKGSQNLRLSMTDNIEEFDAGLGWNTSAFVKGKATATADLDLNSLEQFMPVKLIINLQNSTIDLPIIGLHKSKGESGEIMLSFPNYQFDSPSIGDYKITMNQLDSVGQITFDENQGIRSIDNAKVSLFNSNFTTKMLNDGGIKVYLSGESFDISHIDLSKIDNDSALFSKDITLESKLQRLLMHDNVALKNPVLRLSCSVGTCTDLLLQGQFNDGKTLEIKSDKRNVSVYTNNAGLTLKALGISQNVSDGTLWITAKRYSNRSDAPLKGNLKIQDYYMRKTPILAKLLTIPSITTSAFVGVNDLLENKGLRFKSLNCGLDYKQSILQIEDCVIEGPVISMTGDGEIDMLSRQVKIKGVVVPENIINSLVQAIPMLGPPLSGGENSGIIASSYTIRGKLDEEFSLEVNPLSVLTPGFLRKIIGH